MIVVEFHLRHKYITVSTTTASAWKLWQFSFCQLACNYYSTCTQNGIFTNKNLFESSSVVLVSTYCQSGISGDIGEQQSRGYDQISHALSNIHGLYGWSCNLLDVISVYSLNPGKLPGRFSYKRPGYEAKDTTA